MTVRVKCEAEFAACYVEGEEGCEEAGRGEKEREESGIAVAAVDDSGSS